MKNQDSFWNTTDGEDTTKGGKEFDGGGGDIENIPAKTQCLAIIDEVKWDTLFESDQEYISVRWAVMQPAEFKNRKVFQKIRIFDENGKKSDKAKKMFAAIDANCGGKLGKLGKLPSDEDMTRHLTNKPMVIMVQVWEMEIEGEDRSGNWVSSVSPRKGGAAKAAEPAPQEVEDQAAEAERENEGGNFDNFDDDVPF